MCKSIPSSCFPLLLLPIPLLVLPWRGFCLPQNNNSNDNGCFFVGSEGEEAQDSTSSPAEPQVSGSETDFSDFEGGGEKESGLMARVRQCSLQAINAVIDVSKQCSGHMRFKL